MKTLGWMNAAALAIAASGCTQTTTTRDGLATDLARSMPNGTLSQNGKTINNAASHPTVNNVLTAANTVNGAPQTTPGTVGNSLTPGNIAAAVHSAWAANAAKQAAQQNANTFGPGPVFGPGAFDSIGVISGPGALPAYGN